MSKVLSVADLTIAAAEWRKEGAVIVLAAGVFDPLHAGHVQYLEKARGMGNVLVVSVAADHRVNKGPGRPIYTAAHRAVPVAALRCVDAVTVCRGKSVAPVIDALRPHIFVKGEEYREALTPALRAEEAALLAYGGRLAFASGSVVLSSRKLYPVGAAQWPQPSP